jgi:integrase
LSSLRWNDVYDLQWNFLDGKKITPKKTKNKNKHVLLKYNDAFKAAIEEYRSFANPKYTEGYIFKSRQGDHITVDRIGEIIKDATKTVGINGHYCSHSMRKTFARVRYDHSTQKDKTLVELMRLFNHASALVTMAYIGITDNELEDLYNDVNL